MSRTSRSLFATTTIAVGILAVFASLVFLRKPLLEAWYLRDLKVYDYQRSKRAVEWFGEHGSVRAMRRLADLTRKLSARPDAEDPRSGTCNALVSIGQAMMAIAVNRRDEVVPVLVTLLKEKPPYPPPGNQVRIGAANCLAKMGSEAMEAVPSLKEALDDDEDRFRQCVSDALRKIQDDR